MGRSRERASSRYLYGFHDSLADIRRAKIRKSVDGINIDLAGLEHFASHYENI